MPKEEDEKFAVWTENAIAQAETTGNKITYCPLYNSGFGFALAKWHKKYFYVLGGDCSNKECGYGLIRNPPDRKYYQKYSGTKKWWEFW